MFDNCNKSLFKRFFRNKSGNFSAIGAISMFALVGVAGLAIDNMNLTQAAAELQSLTDAGVVAASKNTTLTRQERIVIFQQILDAHEAGNKSLKDIEFDLTLDNSNPEEVNVSVFTSAEVPLLFNGFFGQKSEVVASSGGKADNRTVEIALALDISTSMDDARFEAMQDASKGFVEDLLTSESADRTFISMVPFGGTVRLPQEMIGFLNPPAEEDEIYWQGGTWNGCLFMFPDDYENGISRSGKFDYMPDFYSFNARSENEMNPWCPREGSELVGPTQEMQVFTDAIDDFTRSDGTGTGMATAWALNTLRPQFRNVFPGTRADLPYRFRKRRRKIIVLMSDGGSSHLVFPRDEDFETVLPFNVNPNSSGRQVRHRSVQQAAQLKTCDFAKSLGVEIYTVGFLIDDDNDRQDLIDCATDLAHYYDAVELEDLDIAFEAIAGNVSGVRISQ